MKCYQRTVEYGPNIEIVRYTSLRPPGKKFDRGKNCRSTSRHQQVINATSTKRKLARIIGANFGPGDLYTTLTYSGQQPTQAQAKKDLDKYLRRVRAYRRREGLPELKYVYVTECRGSSRIHHHIIMPAMSADVARQLWQYEPDPHSRGKLRRIPGHGRAPSDTLDDSGDYEFLAMYIGKEDKPGKRRWVGSLNLDKPKVSDPKEITRRTMERKPTAPKGYTQVDYRLYASPTGDYRSELRCRRYAPDPDGPAS